VDPGVGSSGRLPREGRGMGRFPSLWRPPRSRPPPLPSSAFFQPYSPQDLRDFKVAGLDPPARLLGPGLLGVPPSPPSVSSSSGAPGPRSASSPLTSSFPSPPAPWRRGEGGKGGRVGVEERGREGGLGGVVRANRAALLGFVSEGPKSLLEVAEFLERLVPRCVGGHGGGDTARRGLEGLEDVLRAEVGREEETGGRGQALVRMSLREPRVRVQRVEEGCEMRGWEGEDGREEVLGGGGGRGTKGRTRDGDGASGGGGGGEGEKEGGEEVHGGCRGGGETGGASGTASLSEGKEDDGESARRGAAGEADASLGGLSPVLVLYWRAGSKAIAPKVLGEAEGTGPLGGRCGLGKRRSEGRPRAGGGGGRGVSVAAQGLDEDCFQQLRREWHQELVP
jgi:hypothetical protein